jgi:hypothetical protein
MAAPVEKKIKQANPISQDYCTNGIQSPFIFISTRALYIFYVRMFFFVFHSSILALRKKNANVEAGQQKKSNKKCYEF